MSHVLQRAEVDGQLLILTIDIKQLASWKQVGIIDMVKIINDPSATEDERDMARSTLAEVLMLYEKQKLEKTS